MKIRVFIADDHPVVRDGLRFTLSRSDLPVEVVGEAEDGLTALKMCSDLRPDIALLDISMPRLNGLDTARDILRKDPSIKVIILSLHEERALVEAAIDLGVRGYLTKETASRSIVEAIREVQAGHFYFGHRAAHILVDRKLGAAPSPAPFAALTPQERKVLQLIAEGRTGKEIAADLGISAHTVHAHRTNLMAKLGTRKQTELVRLAIKENLVKP